jgi:glycosyltransferase involved in cell wall biosynthesis
MPKVSVITPAYNVAPYIAETIESVLAQTVRDLEMIVVDDGSTDATLEVASKYARRDPRVRVLRQANGGISVARNQALRHASGEFIAILDSDDIWLPTFLERQLPLFAQHGVDIVTGNAWFMGSRLDGQCARPCPDRRPAPDLTGILRDETAVFILSVFTRRVYERIGGFDETLRTNEDYDYWIRAALAGFRFWRNDEPLGRYRRRDDSLSASELRMLRGILTVLHKARPALRDHPAEAAILEAQIRRFNTERLAAEARAALETGDVAAAGDHLAALHDVRGGATLGLACFIARRAPALLSIAYNLRRAGLMQGKSRSAVQEVPRT